MASSDAVGWSAALVSPSASSIQEYVIRVPKDGNNKFSVMKFNDAVGVDFTKWSQVEMEREKNMLQFESFDGDQQAWLLQHGGKQGKKFRGVREAGVTENASQYVLTQAVDGAFEAFPVEEWYNFKAVQTYKALNYKEADEEFERRERTYNVRCVMIQKRMKEADEAGEHGVDAGAEAKQRKKRANNGAKLTKKKRHNGSDDEALEDSDGCYGESSQVEYMSSCSEESDIEHDGQVSDVAEETDEENEEQQVEDKDDASEDGADVDADNGLPKNQDGPQLSSGSATPTCKTGTPMLAEPTFGLKRKADFDTDQLQKKQRLDIGADAGRQSVQERVVFDKQLDMTSSSRGVWLVKVPKYISSRWDKCPGNIVAGRLKITKSQGQRPNVTLVLSQAIMGMGEKNGKPIPEEYELVASVKTRHTDSADITGVEDETKSETKRITRPTFGVFSQHTSQAASDSLIATEKLFMEGKVVQKLQCRPLVLNAGYMRLKQDCFIKALQPVRQVKKLDIVVQTYKPVSDHKHNIEFEKRKKSEGKNTRDDKDKVMNMLYAAFEKHQYYKINHLVEITKQPVTYLKEILKEVCNYNVKNPHKNMWELKPEYRHYQEDDDAKD